MTKRTELINRLRGAYTALQKLLDPLTENQAERPLSDSEWSVREVTVHLYAWQQVSRARLEAARGGGEPVMPSWARGSRDDWEEHAAQSNVKIQQLARNTSWKRVYEDWTSGFANFLELARTVPEGDLLAEGKYNWIDGQPLIGVLEGSLEHHQEHLDELKVALHALRKNT